jgi:hypothetical protein
MKSDRVMDSVTDIVTVSITSVTIVYDNLSDLLTILNKRRFFKTLRVLSEAKH